MRKKLFKLSLVLLATVLLSTGCTLPWKKKAATNTNVDQSDTAVSASTASSTNALKKFNSYDDLARFISENSQSDSTGRNFNSSSTNNLFDNSSASQMAGGVDADIVKTDGQYVYALVKNELSIIKANPSNGSEVISKVTFKSRPQGILVSGNFLAAFGNDDQIKDQAAYQTFYRHNPYTFLKVFDVSDPAKPKQVRDLDFEGSYSEARLIGDYVYFLTNMSGSYVAGEPLIPRTMDNGQVLSAKCDGEAKCFAPDVFYFDIPYSSYSYNSLTAVNIKDYNEPLSGQIYLLDEGQDYYVSNNNIYITYASHLNEFDLRQSVKRSIVFAKLSADDQDKINKVDASPSYVLNKNEKVNKAAQIIDRYISSLPANDQVSLQTEINNTLTQKLTDQAKAASQTTIYKFSLSASKIEYRAIGEVPGQILNRFSIDENDNFLRLVTSRNQQISGVTGTPADNYSNIYVLDNNLKPLGSLENLATTEKITAARFVGERAYLIAAAPTDPLYVISLKDPTKPAVLGAVKISSASYLKPVDADGTKLIGLGRAAGATEGQAGGLKLTLFDFTDLTKPQELDSYLIGDSSSDSIALSDHNALLYSAEKGLLSIPAVLRDTSNRLSFSGSLIFTINSDKLNLKGKIDHSSGGRFGQADYWGGFDYYDNTVKRSFYINNDLFTFSNKFLKINDLDKLNEIKSLELTSSADDYTITPAGPNATSSIPNAANLSTSTPSGLPSAATTTASSTMMKF